MLQNQMFQPKVIVIRRRVNQGFGFTLRHFIAYPPESWPTNSDTASGSEEKTAMETIFIKEVHLQGPAHLAGLNCGDRVLMVNGMSVAGISYNTVVTMIKQTPMVLRLQVVPKECDILQMYYTDIAHAPETNRLNDIPRPLPLQSTTAHNLHLNSRMISYSPEGDTTNIDEHCQSIGNNDIFENSKILIQQQKNKQQQIDGCILRSKSSNISVLQKPNNNDSDIMIRLRKSIEQKEEFLKSPIPHHQNNNLISNFGSQIQQNSTEKFPINSSSANIFPTRLNQIALSPSGNINQNQKIHQRSNYTSNSLNDRNLNENILFNNKKFSTLTTNNSISNSSTKEFISMKKQQFIAGTSNGTNMIKDKFQKELEFLETLPEMGVTNQVFERKLVSNLAKNFDPFKQLSVNTAANETQSMFKFDSISNGKPRLGSELKSLENNIRPILHGVKEDSPENGEIDELQALSKTTEVIRRTKTVNVNDENKPMRRISYLRATNNEISDFHGDVVNDFYPSHNLHLVVTPIDVTVQSEPFIECVEIEPINNFESIISDKFETEMEIKSSCIYGKRLSEYRSWVRSKIELNGNALRIFTTRNSKIDNNVIEINVKNFNIIDETSDKKKFVFRLQTKPPGNSEDLSNSKCTAQINESEFTDILFKTKSLADMKKLFGLLQEICNLNNHEKQLAEPQKIPAQSSVTTSTYSDGSITPKESSSPLLSVKAELDGGNTDSISPLMKSRKSNLNQKGSDKDLGSPKAKNWKDLLFRRIHGSSSSTSEISTNSYSTGAVMPHLTHGSIGVPLKLCQMSKDNEFLPMIVDVCTKIVETRGLNVIGIYRIPGNKAAISELKEQVNKIDFDWDKISTDVRWEDVNVVSSLLKLFIRTLPDSLLPTSFYINFIEADKKTGERRLKELKYLINTLPPHSYETMRHLIQHLNLVSKNSDVNLMEAKNLAIIFGPSIIRTPNETLEIAVKDMKHQCRIVELLVTQYDYFFENGELPIIESSSPPIATTYLTSQHDQKTTLLLDNVSKIESRYYDKETSITSRFIPNLRRRTHSKRSAISSDTYSGESVLSLEYKKMSDSSSSNKGKASGSSSICSNSKILERHIDISVLLTDEDSSNSRVSDTGSMSLTTITDTLDSKLRSLRSGSESTDETDSQNKKQSITTVPAHNLNFTAKQQPLNTHENIPYADESPERHLNLETRNLPLTLQQKQANTATISPPTLINHQQRQSTNFIRDITKNIALINPRFSSVYESSDDDPDRNLIVEHDNISSEDDSEVSTTSDPKDNINIITPILLERYKNRRDYRLFRSASFNCRSRGGSQNFNTITNSNQNSKINLLTKDEKTDMNLTKKRQIQNKQNRSIKRRHTINTYLGPNDYGIISGNNTAILSPMHRRINNNKNKQDKKKINQPNANVVGVEVDIRIKNLNRRN